MAILYVTSDEQRAGKSAFCMALVRELGRRGKKVEVFKPLTSKKDPSDDPDPTAYEQLLGQSTQQLPLIGDMVGPELVSTLGAKISKIAEGLDDLLVESCASISDTDAVDMADAIDARVLMIIRFRVDLNVDDLARWRDVYGDRLVGYVINGVTRYQGTNVCNNLLPSMEGKGLRVLGVIPECRRLLSVTVRQLVTKLDGRFVGKAERIDRLVEHYLVGGLGLDSGESYFGLRENKAVIVRGDRPDIQMAALQTPMVCMVLTEGIDPIEYVANEAELEAVPIIVVKAATLETMDSLTSITEELRFDHMDKLEAFAHLVDEHVDLEAAFEVFRSGR